VVGVGFERRNESLLVFRFHIELLTPSLDNFSRNVYLGKSRRQSVVRNSSSVPVLKNNSSCCIVVWNSTPSEFAVLGGDVGQEFVGILVVGDFVDEEKLFLIREDKRRERRVRISQGRQIKREREDRGIEAIILVTFLQRVRMASTGPTVSSICSIFTQFLKTTSGFELSAAKTIPGVSNNFTCLSNCTSCATFLCETRQGKDWKMGSSLVCHKKSKRKNRNLRGKKKKEMKKKRKRKRKRRRKRKKA
jgi:hypothetical protein